jgi:hypothetical protein
VSSFALVDGRVIRARQNDLTFPPSLELLAQIERSGKHAVNRSPDREDF